MPATSRVDERSASLHSDCRKLAEAGLVFLGSAGCQNLRCRPVSSCEVLRSSKAKPGSSLEAKTFSGHGSSEELRTDTPNG